MVLLEKFSATGDPEPLAVEMDLDGRTSTVDRVLNTLAEEFPQIDVVISRRHPWTVTFGEDPDTGERLMRAMLEAHRGLSVDKVKSAGQRLAFIKAVIDKVIAESTENAPPTGSTSSESLSPEMATPNPYKPSPSDGQSGDATSKEPPHSGASTGHHDSSNAATSPEAIPKGKRPKKPEHDRSTLASKTLPNVIHVSSRRLKQIYNEALNIPVDTQRNAAAMLIRLFLELSVEAYCKEFVPLPKKHQDKADWGARGIHLDEKIKTTLHHLDPERKDRTLNHAREGVTSDTAHAHTVTNMHGFMHDPERVLNPKELILIWDRWFGLLNAIHVKLDAKK